MPTKQTQINETILDFTRPEIERILIAAAAAQLGIAPDDGVHRFHIAIETDVYPSYPRARVRVSPAVVSVPAPEQPDISSITATVS